MRLFTANNERHTAGFTGTLHVTETCRQTRTYGNRSWEATPSEIETADALCSTCAPALVGA